MVNVDTFSVFFHFLVTTVTAVVILTSTSTWKCSRFALENITD